LGWATGLQKIVLLGVNVQKSLRTTGLEQGFSNFWCYGAHEEIDHNLRSPTINSKNKNKKTHIVTK